MPEKTQAVRTSEKINDYRINNKVNKHRKYQIKYDDADVASGSDGVSLVNLQRRILFNQDPGFKPGFPDLRFTEAKPSVQNEPCAFVKLDDRMLQIVDRKSNPFRDLGAEKVIT